MVIWTSLQACGVVLPFAISTSICRSSVTICSGLYLLIDMTGLPPQVNSLSFHLVQKSPVRSPRITRKLARQVNTSAFIGSNVPTRRHANGESLITAAMSFTRGYFVQGSFQRTPVRVKNGRKSSIDFNDGSTFLRMIAPYRSE